MCFHVKCVVTGIEQHGLIMESHFVSCSKHCASILLILHLHNLTRPFFWFDFGGLQCHLSHVYAVTRC